MWKNVATHIFLQYYQIEIAIQPNKKAICCQHTHTSYQCDPNVECKHHKIIKSSVSFSIFVCLFLVFCQKTHKKHPVKQKIETKYEKMWSSYYMWQEFCCKQQQQQR